MEAQPKKILIITLENTPMFTDIFSSLLSKLSSKATVLTATTENFASQYLADGGLDAIFVADPTVTKNSHKALTDSLVTYVKRGGTLVLGGLFSGFCTPPALKKFFKSTWELPWESGSYLRTTFTGNPSMRIDITPGIVKSYSMKALCLKNVANEDLVYLTMEDSRAESMDFYPELVELNGQGPAVFAQYHRGKLGWIGDVNGEEGSATLATAMMDL